MAAGPARPGDLELELERLQVVLFRKGREEEARELIDQALADARALGVRLQLEHR